MKIKHHPTDETLLAYASGTLSQAMELVIATHMTLCPHCREKVSEMEACGGAMLNGSDGLAMNVDALDQVMAMIEQESANENMAAAPAIAPRRVAVAPSIRGNAVPSLPTPLANLLPENILSLEDIPWRSLAPGVKHFPLKSVQTKGSVRLLKIAPGISIPDHGHGGHEMTLLLKGSYIDDVGRFCAGDVADLMDDTDHQPIADTAEDCICLIATDAPLKFNGILPKLLQPFIGM